MRRRHSVGITQASAASIVACLAVLCVPAVSMAPHDGYGGGTHSGRPVRAVQVGEDDPGAPLGQTRRGRRTQAGGTAGDEG